jgi:hypothetical protein
VPVSAHFSLWLTCLQHSGCGAEKLADVDIVNMRDTLVLTALTLVQKSRFLQSEKSSIQI